jgi:hypothetical protein
MTMTLIETKTLGTAASTIQFTSIPQDSTDLLLSCSLRDDFTAGASQVLVSFNSNTANFSARYLLGTGAAASSSTFARYVGQVNFGTTTSNTFSSHQIYIPNYAGSTQKSYSVDSVTENNATTAYQDLIAGLWADTSAITSITLSLASGTSNFVVGSTVSLYKITKGSSGGVVVS